MKAKKQNQSIYTQTLNGLHPIPTQDDRRIGLSYQDGTLHHTLSSVLSHTTTRFNRGGEASVKERYTFTQFIQVKHVFSRKLTQEI